MLLWEHAVLIEWAKLVGQRNSIWLLLLLLLIFSLLFYSIFSECMCIRYWCINNWLQKSTYLGFCFCPSSNFFLDFPSQKWFVFKLSIFWRRQFLCSFFLCYSTLKQPVHLICKQSGWYKDLKRGWSTKPTYANILRSRGRTTSQTNNIAKCKCCFCCTAILRQLLSNKKKKQYLKLEMHFLLHTHTDTHIQPTCFWSECIGVVHQQSLLFSLHVHAVQVNIRL